MGFLDKAINAIKTFADGTCKGFASSCIDTSVSLRNWFYEKSYACLMDSPTSWQGGDGWNVITTVNTSFVAVGASLLLIFWLIGICTDSLDIRSNLRFETVLKQLAKLVIGEFVVTNSIDILKSMFYLVNALTSGISSASISISKPESVAVYLSSSSTDDIGGSASVAALSFVFLISTAGAGLGLLYLSMIRLFKVLLIVPYGAIATSTIAGSHSISQSTVSYYKYALSTILEAVTMILALRLASGLQDQFIMAGSDAATSGGTVMWLVQTTIFGFVTLGACKEAGQITQHGLGM
jgi:hypothetical protein